MSDRTTTATAAAGFGRAPVNPHDAEEAMRPYLGRIHEANAAALRLSLYDPPEVWEETQHEQMAACQAALDKALELLRVQR